MIHNLTGPLWSLHSNTFYSLFKLLQTLKVKYNELKEAMDTLTKSSVDNLLKRLMSLASRPLVEFKKYEALELVDALRNAVHDCKHEKEVYYRLVFETLQGKLDQPGDQFCNLIFPLLGEKDHEKVLDVVAKVICGRSKNRLVQVVYQRIGVTCPLDSLGDVFTVTSRVILRHSAFRGREMLVNQMCWIIRNPQPVPISNALNVARTSVRSFHSIWSCNCRCRVQ